VKNVISALVFVTIAAGCGGGQYGYARYYAPYGAEDDFLDRAEPLSYEEVRRDPADFQDTLVGWFGIVQSEPEIDPATGQATVVLNFRAHQNRHLCRTEHEDSCRVTVSERPGGSFSARLVVREADREGAERLNVGSLLRVYGTATLDFNDEGGPILETQHYRHWPRGTYVNTGHAGVMRR
jgi:hypothetical protein